MAGSIRGLEIETGLTKEIIAAAYEVHNILGPGLEEKFYRDALMYELELRSLRIVREQEFPVEYKGHLLGLHRVDLIVEGKILLELKAVTGELLKVHVAQTISERNVSKLPVAMLINFGDVDVQVRRLEVRSTPKKAPLNPPIPPSRPSSSS
jgi:GxxExxY protein